MFRFAILVLAGIGLGALLFGGAPSAAAGVGFLALIPIFFLFKLMLIAMVFGTFARRGFGADKRDERFRTGWPTNRGPWRRPRSKSQPDKPAETDRFEEWHRMAHAREEVASWADEPE
jgi:hypothetical protein